MKKRHYLAGPMSGIKGFNYPAFDEAAAELREMGYSIHNPTEEAGSDNREMIEASPDGIEWVPIIGTWGEVLGADVTILSDECGALILLTGWSESPGARLECFTAIGHGYDVFFWYGNYHMLALTSYSLLLHMMTQVILDKEKAEHG